MLVEPFQQTFKIQSATAASDTTVCQHSREHAKLIELLQSGEDVPFGILKMSGVSVLLLNAADPEITTSAQSTLATTILKSAYAHQPSASDKHLGVVPSKSDANLGSSQFKNLLKAKAIVDERKAKKAEAQLKDVGIRVVAMIWMSDKNKLTKVSGDTLRKQLPSYKWKY